jgi:hypothetical protein
VENLAIIWRNDWQGYGVFGYDVKIIQDRIRDVIQTRISLMPNGGKSTPTW